MELLTDLINGLNSIVWGPLMLILILGTGLYLMIRLKVMPLIRLPYGFRMLWRGRVGQGEGEISPFNALMTSLSATIGTGNIAGVATAIAMGGPGALFWMWCTALVGMATKYAEAVLAVRYREVDQHGNHVGGPMYYIKNGLGRRWVWLGTLFAAFGALAGFGIGNTVQANSVAQALLNNQMLGVSPIVTGSVMAVLTALVLIGGIRRIAEVAGKLVPFMAMAYLLAGMVIVVMNLDEVPSALHQIVHHAFNPTAAMGGFAGAAVWAAIRFGVARGVFSNEAGLGSAPIAHASAVTNSPVRQGTIAMLGTFIDTLVVCTVTGLAIVLTGVWKSGETGASLSSNAFEAVLPGVGGLIVSIGLALFAFTTILGWSLYSERCIEYLYGVKAIVAFRIVWILVIPAGAIAQDQLDLVWLVADTLNALMALPNLIALLLLSPVVVHLTRDYFKEKR
jgi:AGCS family alanine or glycine:cation symporter